MSVTYKELLDKAIEVSDLSYSPYSCFPVGASLLAEKDGKEEIFVGCNIENSSYSLCLCAERAAVAQAVTKGYKNFKAVAIIAKNLKTCNPCGACLQVLCEFSTDMDIILEDNNGNPLVKNIKDFLPNMFTPEQLKRNSSLFNK
ncbi:MAG: cytidine deaminase [Candidatus Sericytochromatia bacterium]